MTEQANVEVVQQLYAAFGRGDIPAALHILTEDVEWYMPGPAEIPPADLRRGRAQVAQFTPARHHPRQESGAVVPHAGICAGGAG